MKVARYLSNDEFIFDRVFLWGILAIERGNEWNICQWSLVNGPSSLVCTRNDRSIVRIRRKTYSETKSFARLSGDRNISFRRDDGVLFVNTSLYSKRCILVQNEADRYFVRRDTTSLSVVSIIYRRREFLEEIKKKKKMKFLRTPELLYTFTDDCWYLFNWNLSYRIITATISRQRLSRL